MYFIIFSSPVSFDYIVLLWLLLYISPTTGCYTKQSIYIYIPRLNTQRHYKHTHLHLILKYIRCHTHSLTLTATADVIIWGAENAGAENTVFLLMCIKIYTVCVTYNLIFVSALIQDDLTLSIMQRCVCNFMLIVLFLTSFCLIVWMLDRNVLVRNWPEALVVCFRMATFTSLSPLVMTFNDTFLFK